MSAPLEGLIAHLMRTHRISYQGAEKRAKWIVAKQAERAAAKKIKLQSAQGLLPFDGVADEEATNRFEQDDPTVNF